MLKGARGWRRAGVWQAGWLAGPLYSAEEPRSGVCVRVCVLCCAVCNFRMEGVTTVGYTVHKFVGVPPESAGSRHQLRPPAYFAVHARAARDAP